MIVATTVPRRGVVMAGLEIKSVKSPDETRPFADKGNAAVVNVGGNTALYGTFEPGWKWSEHVKPLAGTDSCQAGHLLYCRSEERRVGKECRARGESE